MFPGPASAPDAIKQVKAEGLITGRAPDALVPAARAARAEVATILRRFIESTAS